ncbi:MAG: hypothetical protein Q8P52_01500, partial [bacterium]|nr:hypothetical protein [bacterium]
MNVSKHTLSFVLLSLFFLLVPLAFVWTKSFALGVSLSSVAVIFTLLLFSVFLAETLATKNLFLPLNFLSWSIPLLVFVGGLSSFAAFPVSMSVFGLGNEVTTLIFLSSLAIIIFVTPQVLRGITSILGSIYLFLIGIFISVFVWLLTYIWTEAFSILAIHNVSSWSGSLYSLSFFAVLGVIFSVFAFEFLSLSRFRMLFFGLLLTLSVGVLAVAGAKEVFIAASAASLLAICLTFFYAETEEKPDDFFAVLDEKKKGHFNLRASLPFLALLIFFLALSIWGKDLSLQVSGKLKFPSEVSSENTTSVFWSETSRLFVDTIRNRPILGSGLNTFSQIWGWSRSEDINQTELWDKIPLSASGFLPTWFIEAGLVFSLLTVVFFCLFITAGISSVRKKFKEAKRENKFLMLSSFLGALIGWLVLFLASPGLLSYLATAVLTGICFAVWQENKILTLGRLTLWKGKKGIIAGTVLYVLLLLTLHSVWILGRKTYALNELSESIVVFNETQMTAEAEFKMLNAAEKGGD